MDEIRWKWWWKANERVCWSKFKIKRTETEREVDVLRYVGRDGALFPKNWAPICNEAKAPSRFSCGSVPNWDQLDSSSKIATTFGECAKRTLFNIYMPLSIGMSLMRAGPSAFLYDDWDRNDAHRCWPGERKFLNKKMQLIRLIHHEANAAEALWLHRNSMDCKRVTNCIAWQGVAIF